MGIGNEAQVVSQREALFQAASKVLAEHGPCEVPIRGGYLQILDRGDSTLEIRALSSAEDLKLKVKMSQGQWSLGLGMERAEIREQHGSEDALFKKLRGSIERAAEEGRIEPLPEKPGLDIRGATLPPAPQEGATSKRGHTLAEERQAVLARVSDLLDSAKAPAGAAGRGPDHSGIHAHNQEHAFACGDYTLVMRRHLTEPNAITIELLSDRDYGNGLTGYLVTISASRCSYEGSHDPSASDDERLALNTLYGWLRPLGAREPG